jgi:hypothetical protein
MLEASLARQDRIIRLSSPSAYGVKPYLPKNPRCGIALWKRASPEHSTPPVMNARTESRRWFRGAVTLRRAGEAYREAGDARRAEDRLFRAARSLAAPGQESE